MRFVDSLYSYDNTTTSRLISHTDGRVKGPQRRATIIGVVHLLMFDPSARKRTIEAGKAPTTYNDQLYAVTGRTYIMEGSDFKMMHSLLTDDKNRGLFFPADATNEENEERAQVTDILRRQADACGSAA
jgi:hypothetical protein